MRLILNNNGGTDETLTELILTWPTASGNLDDITLGGHLLYDTVTPPTEIHLYETDWIGGEADRTIYASSTEFLSFIFEGSIVSSGYTVTLTFKSGCVVMGSH
jgi:hypothetical protein